MKLHCYTDIKTTYALRITVTQETDGSGLLKLASNVNLCMDAATETNMDIYNGFLEGFSLIQSLALKTCLPFAIISKQNNRSIRVWVLLSNVYSQTSL